MVPRARRFWKVGRGGHQRDRASVRDMGMDRAGQTLSATRFATLTGVSRERLRTWERRHGFPTPRRVGRGPRRYAIEDVARVVAVRHAVAEGLPIPEAIARARAAVVDAPPVAET